MLEREYTSSSYVNFQLESSMSASINNFNEELIKISETLEEKERHRATVLADEWLKAESTFNGEAVKHTISIFGSARIPAPDQCHEGNPCLGMAKYYAEAEELSFKIGAYLEAQDLAATRLITGGGPGIMEAASRGARRANHNSIGLNIVLPREQQVNPFIAAKHSIEFQYFALRKMHFLKRAKALLVFPGGFGTLDELFETLTLIQTGKMPRVPVFLYGDEFWHKTIDLEHLAACGMIDQADLELYHHVNSVDEAWAHIEPILQTLSA